MKWFTAKALAEKPGAAHLVIDGEIGESWWDSTGVSSQAFMSEIKALGDVTEITLDINSPGGSVSDGVTIANYLRSHQATVTVNVMGQASSIASVIAMAGDEVRMGLGSWMLVHQPWTVAMGNADQLRSLAGDLDTLSESIMAHYVARAGEDKRDELADLIKGESGEGTILTAEQAVSLGLADSVMHEVRAAASMTGLAKAMAHGAEQARKRLESQEPASAMSPTDALALAFDMTPEQVVEQAAELGDQIVAMKKGAAMATVDDVPAHLRAQIIDGEQVTGKVKGAVAAERERVTSIIKACQTTGQSQLLEKLVAQDLPTEAAAEYIYDVAAASSNARHVNNGHSPEGGHQQGIDTSSVYARRNRQTA